MGVSKSMRLQNDFRLEGHISKSSSIPIGGPMQKHMENAKPTSARERDLVSGGVMSDKIALARPMSCQWGRIG